LPHIGRRSRSERRAFIVAVNDFYFDFKTVSHIGRRSRSERRAFIVAVDDFYFDSRRYLTSGGEAGANDAHSSLLLMISILIQDGISHRAAKPRRETTSD